MAVQEPNVYAGLSVVIGGLMHARPRMFAKVMGELLFFLGEDRLIFGSDYAIWEPRWQVEGFVDWDYPAGEEFGEYPPITTTAKKKILGLNAARLYGIDVPAEYQPGSAGRGRMTTTGAPRAALAAARLGRAGRGSGTPSWTSRSPNWASSLAHEVDGDGTARVRLRVPTYFSAPNFVYLMVADARDAVGRVPGVRRRRSAVEDHFHGRRHQRGRGRGGTASWAPSGDLAQSELRPAGSTSCARPCWPPPTGSAGRCWPRAPSRMRSRR